MRRGAAGFFLRHWLCSYTLAAAQCGAVAVAALVGLSSTACQKQPDTAAEPTFQIASYSGFRNYEDVIARFAAKHSPQAESDFCVVGYAGKDETRHAWVLWRQGDLLVLWEDGETDLGVSRRILNLKTDVVASADDLQGSTYRVTQGWVDAVLASCERSGAKLRIPAASATDQR